MGVAVGFGIVAVLCGVAIHVRGTAVGDPFDIADRDTAVSESAIFGILLGAGSMALLCAVVTAVMS